MQITSIVSNFSFKPIHFNFISLFRACSILFQIRKPFKYIYRIGHYFKRVRRNYRETSQSLPLVILAFGRQFCNSATGGNPSKAFTSDNDFCRLCARKAERSPHSEFEANVCNSFCGDRLHRIFWWLHFTNDRLAERTIHTTMKCEVPLYIVRFWRYSLVYYRYCSKMK